MDQSTEIKLMKASNSTDPPWNEELDDVLNVIALDESSQRSSAVQPAFDEDLHFSQDLSTFQMSSCQQRKEQNQYVSTASPGINVQSTCSVSPLSQHLKVGRADSSGGANVAASSFGGKRSKEIRAKFQAQYHWKSSPEAKGRKLFGILSLIFQAFDCPLTTELEERYVCALQRALVEIQNARSYSQKSQEQEI